MTEPKPDVPEPYDRGEFYRILDEVEGHLAELRYIDIAMAFMEEESISWWLGLREDLVGTGASHIAVTYGKTYPFTKSYDIPEELRFFWEETKKEQVEATLRQLADQANSWAETEINSIKARVEPFTWPVGSVFERECIRPVMDAHDRMEDSVDSDLGLLGHKNWPLGR